MDSVKKKTVLIIALTVSALLINTPWLAILLGANVRSQSFDWLYEISFFHWDWLLAFCLAGSALAGTICWKPGSPILRGIIIFFSIIAIMLASIQLLGVIVMSTLKF